ncbi:carbamoyl-phosphate synth [Phaffia rhodozyma]|uniref:Ammonium-dependent carbamoyl phosphate synthetase n=1 Tax=Phaffia rhodozyma TaxID=264483 RepID=A0A0F7SR08_PHARH|nr:carbamoyl-phosphate synth [Phaffia rhodozyma]
MSASPSGLPPMPAPPVPSSSESQAPSAPVAGHSAVNADEPVAFPTGAVAVHPRYPVSNTANVAGSSDSQLFPPATGRGLTSSNETSGAEAWEDEEADMVLELSDGTAFEGLGFGASDKSAGGECVFQTGMVGYPESLTDPSYSSQILILTYPMIGNYGVPARPSSLDPVDVNLPTLPVEFESSKIHVAALVVGAYHTSFSHYLAKSSLGKWLKDEGIPAIWGVDTRALTKKIREKGVMLGRVLARKDFTPSTQENRGRSLIASISSLPERLLGDASNASPTPSPSRQPSSEWREKYQVVPFSDPNFRNLVAEVSVKEPILYTPKGVSGVEPSVHPREGRPLRVLALDLGMKYNQIRCFTKRGIEVKVLPWDYNFNKLEQEPYDGLFLSNGPGDPSIVSATIDNIKEAITAAKVPIFGICLGHQLLAQASGAKTSKMKYGNRGMNIPCNSRASGRCYITSQNHGYQVDVSTLTDGWEELFYNVNDNSNEGIWKGKDGLPYFSVQFHPESSPGPKDTEFLFDVFIKSMTDCAEAEKLVPVQMPGGDIEENASKNPKVKVKKVVVLGSGGLSIGQAGEFDYSGSQAIKALKEEGIYTVLVNPNIATIQTSKGLADKIYYLPVTPDFVRKILKYEKPDGIYVTFGGQTALSVGIALKDEFEELGCKVLGTQISTIITTEDRELFARAMEEIGEKCAESATAVNFEEAAVAAKNIGYPVIIRAAFALGGLGSGFASNESELKALCDKAFATSPQVLVEKSMKGWKEIEYEVVRDCRDNCITVCNMENFDPLGVHTGDSIVVAPSQTLSDADYNMLRTTATNVIRHLGVVGECNIQYALNPYSKEYCIIEVNARLSRSSALASKATGYPLAFIAAKLGLNIPLNEIKNSVTKVTSACFEPSLDYIVVKIPRWDLKKFARVSTLLGSSMKSVGEVMSIGRTFEETIQKAIRAIDDSFPGFSTNDYVDDIDSEIRTPSDKRLFAIATAFSRGYSVDKIHQMSNIDKWFLTRLERLSKMEKLASTYSPSSVPSGLIRQCKQLGFSDRQVAKFLGSNELAVRRLRQDAGIAPFVKQIDTVAAEFPAFTNYLYTTYNATEHDISFEDHGVMVLGSGVYRIGSSVEFDWCAVTAIRTLRKLGLKTVMVNYNPETVSTDYDEADRLYFENISLETILDIYDAERSSGVMLSMGGQTPNNIALQLHRQNVKIYGTSPEMIDTAENRYKFSRMLDKIGVDQPLWKELTSFDEAEVFCNNVGYPVLVRPSYVLSGAAMNVVFSADDLATYLNQATAVSRDHPVVITKYIEEAKEIEMDAVARDGKMVMHYISEHVENAGVHSGDATLILPPQDLDPETVRRIEVATQKIGMALNVTGPYNIQFMAKNNEIKVIECNLRAARSTPFVSKVTDINAIELATKVMLDFPITPYPEVKMPKDYVGIKVPQFSFSRLAGADPILGVEMASTGEVACFGKDKYEAYLKALISTGIKIPKKNILFSIGSYKEKMELLPCVQKLHRMGYNIFATAGTSDFIQEHGIPVKYLEYLEEDTTHDAQKSEYSLQQHFANHLIDLYVNLPSKNRYRRPTTYISSGYKSRRLAVDFAVPLVNNVKCAKLFIEAIVRNPSMEISSVDFKTSHETYSFPGLISIQTFVPEVAKAGSKDFAEVTKAAIRGGFTMVQVLPQGVESQIHDEASLRVAQANADGQAHCDYTFGVSATSENASLISESITSGARSLFVPASFASNTNKVATVSGHFAAWPAEKPIVTDAKTTDLASILLLTSLHNRSVHVTNVKTRSDIELIALSKEKGLPVTCDVAVYSLFFASQDFPAATCLPSKDDQKALWDNLAVIDTFSVGSIPYQLGLDLKQVVSPLAGIEETLPLLLSAVNDGRLTLEDITLRLHDNPRQIFDLPEQVSTSVEVDTNRSTAFPTPKHWSPLSEKIMFGGVHRVVHNGQAFFIDGVSTSTPFGRDLSGEASPRTRNLGSRASFSRARPTVQTYPSMSSPKISGRSPVLKPYSPSPGQVSRIPSFPDLTAVSTPRFGAIQPHPSFHRRHVLTVKNYTREDLHAIFSLASEMRTQVERHGSVDTLKGRVICNLFFEPSTRTSTSFEAAMKRCGGEVTSVSVDRSSVTKGESLADTIRTVGCYTDAIVLRHPAIGSAKAAAKFSPVPLINAGDGIGEHPTQSLLDVFTMREELGSVNGITVTMIGDLKNGRTVHSLVKLLSLYSVSLNFVSPPSLMMPESVKAEARKAGVSVHECVNLDEVISKSDVLYVTRIQKERFENEAEYEAVKDMFVINNEVLTRAKPTTIVMHPLPRVNEIDPEVDFDSRAAYFRQMRLGLFIRMALLTMVLG